MHENILNITNGDCAVGIMERAGIPGSFLPWRDVLHDGPVPEGLSLEALSEVRAEFIADQGWGDSADINSSFIERDNCLKSFAAYDKVVLWFEHDLYDQLQLLQILDWLNSNNSGNVPMVMICVDRYLGMLSPEEMIGLLTYQEPVSESQLQLASRAWSSFCSPTPEKWQALLETDTTALRFLKAAVIRLMEEYPGSANGLSRTAAKALEIVSLGESNPVKVFGRYQESEESRYLGDSSFWKILNSLLGSSPPLLKLSYGKELLLPTSQSQDLTITQVGRDVLAGKRDWLEIVEQDRWLGGVHLTVSSKWRWNAGNAWLANSD